MCSTSFTTRATESETCPISAHTCSSDLSIPTLLFSCYGLGPLFDAVGSAGPNSRPIKPYHSGSGCGNGSIKGIKPYQRYADRLYTR